HLKKDCKGGKVGNKANGSGINVSVDGSTSSLKGQNIFNKSFQVYYVTYVSEAYFVQNDDVPWVWGWAVVRLPDPKLKTLSERGIECIFVGYAEHSNAFRFYVIEPNDSVAINLIIKSKDVIFDEKRLSSVSRPSQRSQVNGTEDIGGSVALEKVTKEVVQQPEPELRKIKMYKTLKDFGPEFQLYLIKRTRDEVSDQQSYCFNIEDDPKTLDEAMLLFGKKQLMMRCTPSWATTIRCWLIYLQVANLLVANGSSKENLRIKHESNGIAIPQSHYIENVLKKFNYFDCTPVSTLMDTSEKLMPNNGQAVSQLEYSRVIGYLMYAMTCTRLDIIFVVCKLSRYTSNLGTQHWQAIQRASKKQTYITGSTMESEFVALAAAAPISIRCDSASTLAKAYSQMYNGKSSYLCVRHSMIRELITNEVISIEFVRSQQNLVDHLTNGLARDLVIKSAEWMRLKSN
nr:zinc finger, CCHC-type [Tanacetum cinerariifolium]